MICKECKYQNKLRTGKVKFCSNCGSPLYEQKTNKEHGTSNLKNGLTISQKSNNISTSKNTFSVNELPRAKAFRLGSNSLREEGYLNYSKVKNLFAASGRGINP